jgi:hypothetical protein
VPETKAPSDGEEMRTATPGIGVVILSKAAWLGLAVVGIGVACRLFRYWLNFPVWTDEASLALNLAERDYHGLLRELNHQQVAPLLFLWIEKTVWLWAGPSEWSLRLVPLLAGIGGLVLSWRLVRAVLPPPSAVLAVGLLAVSTWPIELACSIKPYALDLFVAVLLLWLANHALRRPDNRAWLAALTLFVPFAVCLSYPAVFVAGAVSLVLAPLVWRRSNWTARGWFVAFNILLLASFFAHLHFVGREKDPANAPDLNGYMKSFWYHGFPHGGPLRSAWWVVRIHVGRMFSYPVEFNGGGVVGALLVGLGVHALLRRGQRALLALCILPFALHLLAAFLHRYPYGMSPRLEQHLAPGFCILAGSGLAALVERLAVTPPRQARWLLTSISCLVLVGVVGTFMDFCHPYRDEVAAWARQVVRHIQREMRPGDRIVVCGTAQNCHVCLRWQLLALADRIDDGESAPASRVWIVDPRIDEEPVGAPEPIPRLPVTPPDVSYATTNWHASKYRRFHALLGDDARHVYRFFCDVYACEPMRDQSAAE